MIHLLERERLKRRQECREIGKSVRELEGVWRGVERVIVDSLGDVVKDLSSSAAGSSNSLVSICIQGRVAGFIYTCVFNSTHSFQQYLLKLIKHTSSTNGVDGTGTGASASAAGYSKKEMVQVANFERQIANLQSTCSALELQVKELGKARDDANNSERRVRRGLYRVASGRLKIGEVLQVSYCYCSLSCIMCVCVCTVGPCPHLFLLSASVSA